MKRTKPARRGVMESKTIRISGKRQITIPQQYYDRLGFQDQAECFFRGNELVIRPVHPQSGGEFAEQILKDLVEKGYSGQELLTQFKMEQAKVRPAVESMLDEADSIARGERPGVSYSELFSEEE